MKKIIITLLIASFVLILSNCKKDIKGCTDSTATNYNSKATVGDGTCVYEPQGPIDPSFENYGSWADDVYDDHYFGFVTYPTGTGFMPTKGVYYLNMGTANVNGNIAACDEKVYQNNVSFSQSTNLIFDYEIQGPGVAKLLFTSNGTTTLWTSDSTVTPVQKLNETVILPSLPDKGRLLIQFKSTKGSSQFHIDNIRTQ